MIKQTFSLPALLSAAALTSGVVLASIHSAQACFLSKNKGTTTTTLDKSPTLISKQSNSNAIDTKKLGIIGGSAAAIAGLSVAGVIYKGRHTAQSVDDAIAQEPQEVTLVENEFSMPVTLEADTSAHPEVEMAESTPDKDLTLVG